MYYQVKSRRVLSTFSGAVLLFFSLYLGSGSLYLFLEGGARLENYISSVETEIVNSLFGVCVILLWLYVFFNTLLNRGILRLGGGSMVIISLVLFVLSSAYSDFPYVSLGVGLFLVSWYFFINAYIAAVGVNKVINTAAVFLFAMVAVSIAVALFVPTYGLSVGWHEGSWQGIFNHKNRFGYIAVLSLIFVAFSTWPVSLKALLITVCVLAVYKSKSSAALSFLFLLPILALLWSVRLGRLRLSLVFLVFLILCLFLLAVWIFTGIDPEFLNNRGRIWSFAVEKSFDALFLGHGLYQYPKFSEVNSDLLVSSIGFYVRSTHNGFVDAFFSFGMVALFLVFSFFYKVFCESKGALLGFLYGVFMIYINIFESNLFSINIFFMMLILLICCGGKSEPDRADI